MSVTRSGARRVEVSGKFLRAGTDKFFVKGLSYGPFAPNDDDEPFPPRDRLRRDFTHMRALGANTIRIYYPPPVWLLDEALDHGLRVFIDVPWEKHRCFFEDWEAMERARDRVRQTARDLGTHPAVFAISVVNEIPVDVVRFQGRRRVERFIEELIGIVKQEASECLATFVNFPTTEFLEVQGCDFACFNVYLHNEQKLGDYLDRLQHIAGNKPLVLGEYGIDSLREGDVEQAAMLSRHLNQVFRHGLSGSVIFAYTDDWFTGGHQIEDWCFGVTDRDRNEKPAAAVLKNVWRDLPHGILKPEEQPKVSVVVCSYNGSKTIRSCLLSLMNLDYPDYEVILVDDGSTDDTAIIAGDFPQVICHRQENRGLSAARNTGAELATGEIVAYTDDDCVADEHWLLYLVAAMQDQRVEAIGGPNISPESDGWIARCVAASPGNPSHVMLDDQHAEHVPGCNMAFRLGTLLGIGGFDPAFHVAGDDVDVCWRLLDSDLPIGYAPGAMVWHHRRATVKAYARQQRGYGRSEALVHFKHPQRCGAFGRSNWNGIIYGEGAVGLPLLADQIYHGRFGSGLFQTIYRHNHYGLWAVIFSLEWHLVAVFLLLLSTLYWPLAGLPLVMWAATAALAIRSAVKAPLARMAPWWTRPLVAYLYVMQPVWRGWHRLTYLLRNRVLPKVCSPSKVDRPEVKRVSATIRDTYWDSDQSQGREQLLDVMVKEAKRHGWAGDYDNAWADWDIKLVGDRWHDVTCYTATEELGWPRRFTRIGCRVHPTYFSRVTALVAVIWTGAGVVSGQVWAMAAGALLCGLILFRMDRSRRRCLKAITRLAIHSGRLAGLQGVLLSGESTDAGEAAAAERGGDIEPKHDEARGEVQPSLERSHELGN